MFSLFLRNLFFIILQPGLGAGLVPYLILGDKAKRVFAQPLQFHQYAGAGIFLIGLSVMLHCIYQFAVKGRGTLSPADPPKHLVITGLYRFSRNPMYVGVLLLLVGEAIFFSSRDLWIYSGFGFIAFNIFILLFEEPLLRKDFGDEYKQYCRRVRRWV